MSRKATLITINFATVDHLLISRVRAFLVGAAVLFVLLAAVQIASTASYRSRTVAVVEQAKLLEASEDTVRPAMDEREQLVRNLGEMTSLIDARRFSWTRLLTAVEEAFPSGMALARLEYDPRERLLALEGDARSPEALSSLMIGLQRTAILKNPLLKRQSMEKGTLTFHVTVSYDEVLAAGPVPEQVRR